MAILNIVLEQVGVVGVNPSIAYIATNNTIAEVTATGFLNKSVAQGYAFTESMMCLVSTKTSPSAASTQVGWLEVSHSGTDWSLVSTTAPGSVVLPTIANHIATFTNTTGGISEDAATAINGGNIQAGLSGTAGYVASFPSAAAKGSLRLTGVANTGDTLVTISNALHGQASVYSIPDGGQATAEFIISDSAGTQHVTSGGLQVDAGIVSSGLAAGGFVGQVDAYPTTTASGVLSLKAAVNATGNFDTVISNSTAVAQDQVITIPDSGAATAVFDVSPSVSAAVAPKTIVREITAGFAALATAGTVTVQVAPSVTSQFTIVDIKVMYGAAGLSGGGGDRLLNLTDGTIVFNQSGITAALLGTPIYTVWGGTGNPLPGTVSTTSTAGADIVLQYAGGTTDYTAGDVTIQVTLAQVTL